MNTIDNPWDIYSEYRGNDTLECFSRMGIPDTAIVEVPAMLCHHSDPDETATEFAKRYCNNPLEIENVTIKARNILAFTANEDRPEVREFLSRCAAVYLATWQDGMSEYSRPRLPCAAHPRGAVIDLASGPEATTVLNELDESTMYYFVDRSYFVHCCITEYARVHSLMNVHSIHGDIMRFTTDGIGSEHIDVIRAKNLFTYIPQYLHRAPEHIRWLSDNGRLVFAEYTAVPTSLSFFLHPCFAAFIQRILLTGMVFEYSIGDPSNPLDVNKAILCRNPGHSPEVSLSTYDDFVGQLR